MSPQITETHIPSKLTLSRRPTCSPRADERPMLRTQDGHVMAVVEQWTPAMASN